MIATEKSADGVVGGTSFAEGLNAGKTLECGTLELAMRLKTHHWSSEQRERVKPGRRCSKEPKPVRRSPLPEPLARKQNKPFALNLANRRIRTRMYGGVGGRSREAPPIPISDSKCLNCGFVFDVCLFVGLVAGTAVRRRYLPRFGR